MNFFINIYAPGAFNVEHINTNSVHHKVFFSKYLLLVLGARFQLQILKKTNLKVTHEEELRVLLVFSVYQDKALEGSTFNQ